MITVMSECPAGGSHPMSTSLFGPSTIPVGPHSPSGKDLLTTGSPVAAELAVTTSSSPAGLAEVPSLLIKKLFETGSYAHASSPDDPLKTSFCSAVCVRVEMKVAKGGESPGLEYIAR